MATSLLALKGWSVLGFISYKPNRAAMDTIAKAIRIANESCGGCHKWGENPPMKNGICTVCGRTKAQIEFDHEKALFSDDELAAIKAIVDCGVVSDQTPTF